MKKLQIIVISGKKQSGKDTAAKVLIDNFGYNKIAFADQLKLICSKLIPMLSKVPIKQEQFEKESFKQSTIPNLKVTYRQFLQYFGTDFVRTYIDQDFWVKSAVETILKSPKKTKFVITDCRFENEIALLKKLILKSHPNADIKTIRIERVKNSFIKRILSKWMEHPSETGLDKYKDWDYVMYNYRSLKIFQGSVKLLGEFLSNESN